MKKRVDFHPILFAILPIIFLFSHNVGLISLDQVAAPILLMVGFAILLRRGLFYALNDQIKADIIASLFLLLFFSYGHLFNLVGGANLSVGDVDIGQHKYIFPVWAAALALCSYFFIRTHRDLQKFADFLNIMASVLVMFNIFTAIYGLVSDLNFGMEIQASPLDLSGEVELQPDIYYIILDGCARADIIQDIYQVDISELDERLTERGFFVANESHSNYSQTYLSLASSLNFTYLDVLADEVGARSDNRLPLREMIHDNRVSALLKQQGYKFISFATGMDFTEIKEADRYLTNRWSLNEFHNILLNSTPIPGLLNRLLSKSSNFQYQSHRRRILYSLESLGAVAKDSAPTFTFAHILACHPPFVFGENGEERNPGQDFSLADGNFFTNKKNGREEYIASYGKQYIFIRKKLEEAVDDIILNSDTLPIIIMQGDHGGGSMLDFTSLENTNIRERMSIFNAYYLPYGGNQQLYSAITPVNTFRVIINYYYSNDNEELALLKDRSFYSPLNYPYAFTEVTDVIEEAGLP